jgi:hypothetical protein
VTGKVLSLQCNAKCKYAMLCQYSTKSLGGKKAQRLDKRKAGYQKRNINNNNNNRTTTVFPS